MPDGDDGLEIFERDAAVEEPKARTHVLAFAFVIVVLTAITVFVVVSVLGPLLAYLPHVFDRGL